MILLSSDLGNAQVKLNQFLSSGKGIIVFPSSEMNSGFKNSLNSIGISSSGGLIKTEKGQAIRFSETDFNHPLFENIFMDEKKKQIESPEIYSYYKINPGAKGKSIIKLEDESSFLSEYTVSEGKILLFSASPVFLWSDFPIKGIFAPLVTKSVMYLSAYNKSEANYFNAQPKPPVSEAAMYSPIPWLRDQPRIAGHPHGADGGHALFAQLARQTRQLGGAQEQPSRKKGPFPRQ